MKEKYVVYEINEEELNEILGGEKQTNYYPPVLCAYCRNTSIVGGYIVKNRTGSILKVHFAEPMCENCAQKDVDLYLKFGWEFVSWL